MPRVVWLGLEDSYGLQKLLHLHQALGNACVDAGLATDVRPFCAHITLGRTKDTERMSTQERRTLRGFGKWLQDQERPVGLQQLLVGDSTGKGAGRGSRSLRKGKLNTKKRGNRRHKSWIAGGGHAKLERDLGALNAELALEAGGSGDSREESKQIEVGVEAVHVMEAVREPGSKHVSYDTLLEIPLAGRPPAASTPAAAAVGSSPSVSNLRGMEAAEADFAPGESAVRQGHEVLDAVADAVAANDDSDPLISGEIMGMSGGASGMGSSGLSAADQASLAEFLADETDL